MALSHVGAGLARPFTSFRVLVSKSPRMYDISLLPWAAAAGGRCGERRAAAPSGKPGRGQSRGRMAAVGERPRVGDWEVGLSES